MRSATAALILAFVAGLAVQAAPTAGSDSLAVRSNSVAVEARGLGDVSTLEVRDPKKKKAKGAAAPKAPAPKAAGRSVEEEEDSDFIVRTIYLFQINEHYDQNTARELS